MGEARNPAKWCVTRTDPEQWYVFPRIRLRAQPTISPGSLHAPYGLLPLLAVGKVMIKAARPAQRCRPAMGPRPREIVGTEKWGRDSFIVRGKTTPTPILPPEQGPYVSYFSSSYSLKASGRIENGRPFSRTGTKMAFAA